MNADVLIIGCGPAGLQAAIHASRAKVSVVLVGKTGNSAIFSTEMENYFGISVAVSGKKLLENGISQAKNFGAQIIVSNILSVLPSEKGFHAIAESGTEIDAKQVILATGISRSKLNVPGEKEFVGKGVSYCAHCDCNFYKGKTVAIVGDQSEAAVSAELMTHYASKVYWITPKTDVDESLIKTAEKAGVTIVKSEVKSIKGDAKVTQIIIQNEEIQVDGVFIELGGKPSADIAMDLGLMPEIDDTIKINRDCSTQVSGVFACGDITGRPWQVAKAVGEGAVAGLSAASYAKEISK